MILLQFFHAAIKCGITQSGHQLSHEERRNNNIQNKKGGTPEIKPLTAEMKSFKGVKTCSGTEGRTIKGSLAFSVSN